MDVLLVLILLLGLARAMGEIAARLGQSAMLGEILAGLILGPTLLGQIEGLSPVEPNEAIELLAHLGILFLMFLAGLETDIRLIRKVAGPSVLISVVGAAISFGAGYATGRFFGLTHLENLFLGGALSTSSIVVTARVLGDYGVMGSEVGLISMATNAIDDVLSMLVVLLLVSVVGQEADDPLWWMLVKLLIYTAVATGVGLLLFRPLMRFVGRLRSDEIYFSVAVLIVLLFSFSADWFGLADVLGAFVAGAFLHYTEEAEPAMIERVEAISAGFLVPVFFAAMGLKTNLVALFDSWWSVGLLGATLVAAILGKMIGCGGAAKLAGYSWRDSYVVGAGMVPRAEMTLILLGIGLGVTDPEGRPLLSEIIGPLLVSLVFLSALVTSPLLRVGLRNVRPPDEPDARPAPA